MCKVIYSILCCKFFHLFYSQHYAARSGHLEICKLLISYGATVSLKTKSGKATPLHRAAYMGHTEVVSLLLAHNAKPSDIDSDGMTPLHKVVIINYDTWLSWYPFFYEFSKQLIRCTDCSMFLNDVCIYLLSFFNFRVEIFYFWISAP